MPGPRYSRYQKEARAMSAICQIINKELAMAKSAVNPLDDTSALIRSAKIPNRYKATDSFTARKVTARDSTAVNLVMFTAPTSGLRKKLDRSVAMDDRPKHESACTPSDLFLG